MIRGSGTSQSAAVVSGSVALLLSKHPEYSPDQVKALLRKTAALLKGVSTAIQGRGVIDLAAANVRTPGPVQTPAVVKGGASLNAARANTGLRELLGYRWNFDSCNPALLPLCKLKPVYGPALVGNRPNPSSRSSGRLHLSFVRPVPASPPGRFAAADRNSAQCLRRRFHDGVMTSFNRSPWGRP